MEAIFSANKIFNAYEDLERFFNPRHPNKQKRAVTWHLVKKELQNEFNWFKENTYVKLRISDETLDKCLRDIDRMTIKEIKKFMEQRMEHRFYNRYRNHWSGDEAIQRDKGMFNEHKIKFVICGLFLSHYYKLK